MTLCCKVTLGAALMVLCVMVPSISAPAQNAPASQPPDADRSSPEQHIAALKAAKAREGAYLDGLAAAVKNEQRNDAWAQRTEADLRNSFASAHLAAGRLQSVDCRTSKCDIQIQLQATSSVASAVDQQMAVTQWIAAGTPCGYTMVPDQAPKVTAASTVRIYLTCSK